eukprot:3763960-Pleurochrysis_carterae.AAC.1
MAEGTYVPTYSTEHVATHSRHARTRDGDTIERGGGRDVPPTHHPLEQSLLGDNRTGERTDWRTREGSCASRGGRGFSLGSTHTTVRYVTECAARTLWHRERVRGVGTGGLRP